MLRLVELALFLAPFAVFIVWRTVGKRSGPPSLGLVVGAGCVLLALAGALVWLSEDRALPPDAAYAPARFENGHIVAGHAAPR
jgi:hydroxyethylthiazole kinase-like sugar kinase family protein